MQKLRERDTYTPQSVPQALGNCGLSLNSSKGLRNSVADLKTSFNNSDAALTVRGHTGQDLRVPAIYVLNKRGEPLMPCNPRKARVLLKQGKKAKGSKANTVYNSVNSHYRRNYTVNYSWC